MKTADNTAGKVKDRSLQRIDYRIKATKAAMNPDRVYKRHMRSRTQPFTTYDEFGLSSNKMPVTTRYIWLLSKLGVLYCIRLVRLISVKAKKA